MGEEDLHSIAFSSHSPDNLGFLNPEILSSQFYMEMERGYTPPAAVYCHGDYLYAANNSSSSNCVEEEVEEECAGHEYNTSSFTTNSGYLEDVLLEFSSKRRRLHYTSNKNCSSSDFIQNCGGNFDTDQIINADGVPEMKALEEAISETYDSSSSSYKESTGTQWTPYDDDDDDDKGGTLYCSDPIMLSSGANEKNKKKRVTMTAKVVYPFAVVKPGGFEGDMTLNDINERILMPPTRPVHHPVGDFACRPVLASPQGPGLSGKAVVAFTRVHTQGRGTITIIRTRG